MNAHHRACPESNWIRLLAFGWVLALIGIVVCYATWERTIDVHAEDGPVEVAQLAAWCASLAVIIGALALARSRRDFLSALALGVVATLAALREMDFHEYIRSESSFLPPIHFRADWFTDPGAPLGAKIFWGLAFVLGGALLLVPLLAVKAPTRALLKLGDAPTWLLMIAFACLGAGYAFDDLLGRGRLGVHYEVTQGIEEVFELFAAIAFLLGAWRECQTPLSTRLVAAGLEHPQESLVPSGSDVRAGA